MQSPPCKQIDQYPSLSRILSFLPLSGRTSMSSFTSPRFLLATAIRFPLLSPAFLHAPELCLPQCQSLMLPHLYCTALCDIKPGNSTLLMTKPLMPYVSHHTLVFQKRLTVRGGPFFSFLFVLPHLHFQVSFFSSIVDCSIGESSGFTRVSNLLWGSLVW